MNVDAQLLSVGVSLGLAIFPTDARDAEALQRSADAAMYVSKRAGGGFVRCAQDQADGVIEVA